MNRDDVLFCPDATFAHAPKSRQFRKLPEKPELAQTEKTARKSNFVCAWSLYSFRVKTKRNRRTFPTPGHHSRKLSNPGAGRLGFRINSPFSEFGGQKHLTFGYIVLIIVID